MANDQLQKRGPAPLPAFIKADDDRGKENVGVKDIRFPALKLAQSMSAEVKRTEPEYIEGLREGEFFNSVTRDIYGEDPISFVVINYLGHRNTLFDPNNRKVILESNLRDDDERCQFTEEVIDGVRKRIPPKATTFADFLIAAMINGLPKIMTLSFKKTQLGRAKDINSITTSRDGVPSFAFQFKAQPVVEKRPKGTFYGWRVQPDGWPTENLYNYASDAYDKFAGKEVKIDHDDADEPADPKGDDVPF